MSDNLPEPVLDQQVSDDELVVQYAHMMSIKAGDGERPDVARFRRMAEAYKMTEHFSLKDAYKTPVAKTRLDFLRAAKLANEMAEKCLAEAKSIEEGDALS